MRCLMCQWLTGPTVLGYFLFPQKLFPRSSRCLIEQSGKTVFSWWSLQVIFLLLYLHPIFLRCSSAPCSSKTFCNISCQKMCLPSLYLFMPPVPTLHVARQQSCMFLDTTSLLSMSLMHMLKECYRTTTWNQNPKNYFTTINQNRNDLNSI